MPADPPPPNGLVFFPPGTPPRHRRRRTTFVLVMLAATLALVWPVYALFGGVYPLVLGLPFSLAWVVGWLLIVFAALVWLYRAEDRGRPNGTGRQGDGATG